MKTHYETLGVGAEAGDAAIEGAYKALIKRHHPDKRGPEAAGDDEQAKVINEAYRVLRDPEKRRLYDLAIGLGRSPETRPTHPHDRQSDFADAVDDTPLWVALGFVVLVGLVIAVAAHLSSERWLATHRNGSLKDMGPAASAPAPGTRR